MLFIESLYQIKNIISKSNKKIDVHLMVEEPYKFIPWYAKAGANIITFHLITQNNLIINIYLPNNY